MYTVEAQHRAIERQRALAKAEQRRERKPCGLDGFKRMQVDSVLYHKTRMANAEKYGVRDCWAEPEFVRDMERRHPELRTNTKSGKISGRVGGGAETRESGKLTPWGRVTFSKTY